MVKRIILTWTLGRRKPTATATGTTPATPVITTALKSASTTLTTPTVGITPTRLAVRLATWTVVTTTRRLIPPTTAGASAVISAAPGPSAKSRLAPRLGFNADRFGRSGGSARSRRGIGGRRRGRKRVAQLRKYFLEHDYGSGEASANRLALQPPISTSAPRV